MNGINWKAIGNELIEWAMIAGLAALLFGC